jgi:hypothetical protein
MPKVRQEFEITKEQIDHERHKYLAQDRVLGVADEGLDPQILFDPAEENLDLPALLVDIGDGLGNMPEPERPIYEALICSCEPCSEFQFFGPHKYTVNNSKDQNLLGSVIDALVHVNGGLPTALLLFNSRAKKLLELIAAMSARVRAK